jgi:hypothetical protein
VPLRKTPLCVERCNLLEVSNKDGSTCTVPIRLGQAVHLMTIWRDMVLVQLDTELLQQSPWSAAKGLLVPTTSSNNHMLATARVWGVHGTAWMHTSMTHLKVPVSEEPLVWPKLKYCTRIESSRPDTRRRG